MLVSLTRLSVVFNRLFIGLSAILGVVTDFLNALQQVLHTLVGGGGDYLVLITEELILPLGSGLARCRLLGCERLWFSERYV